MRDGEFLSGLVFFPLLAFAITGAVLEQFTNLQTWLIALIALVPSALILLLFYKYFDKKVK